jgi:hypothetical protein
MSLWTPEVVNAWLAALVDGEGSVMLITHRDNRRGGRVSLRPRVAIYNTDARLIEALVERTGIDRWTVHQRSPERHKSLNAYRWHMGATEIREWGPRMLPYLVLKREHMVLLLECLSYTSTYVPHDGAQRAEWGRRLEIQAAIQELNRKGRT